MRVSLSGMTNPKLFFLYPVSRLYPKHSYLDAFNKVLPDMKNSIVSSVDGLCDKAISKNLLTLAEKSAIFVDNDKHRQASRFLDNLALKIAVDPPVLALLMNMLSELGLRTCNQIVLGIGKCYRGGWVGGGGGGGGGLNKQTNTLTRNIMFRETLGTEEERTRSSIFYKLMVLLAGLSFNMV